MSRQFLLLAVFLVSLLILPRPGKCQGGSPPPQGKGQNNQTSTTPTQGQAAGNPPARTASVATPKPLVGPGLNSSNPAQSEQDPKRDLERESTDANNSIAKTTFWGTVAAWVQIVVGIAGMWFIWATLKATQAAVKEAQKSTDALIESNNHLKAANDVARDAHNAERRPWLSLSIRLDAAGMERHEPGEGHYRLTVYPTVTNHGSTPATGVFFSFHIALGLDEEQAIAQLKLHEDLMDYRPDWQDHEFQAVFPEETRDLPKRTSLIGQLDIDQALGGRTTASAWLGATVHYESQHSGIRHTTLIGKLMLVYPQDKRLRFDVISRFDDWIGQELKMDTISYAAE